MLRQTEDSPSSTFFFFFTVGTEKRKVPLESWDILLIASRGHLLYRVVTTIDYMRECVCSGTLLHHLEHGHLTVVTFPDPKLIINRQLGTHKTMTVTIFALVMGRLWLSASASASASAFCFLFFFLDFFSDCSADPGPCWRGKSPPRHGTTNLLSAIFFSRQTKYSTYLFVRTLPCTLLSSTASRSAIR